MWYDEERMKRHIKNYERILQYSTPTHLTAALMGTLISFKGHATFRFLEDDVNKTITGILAIGIVTSVPIVAEQIVSVVHRSKE